MKNSTVFDCVLVDLPMITAVSGSITAVNNDKDLPFEIKRVYYLYDVPNAADRGAHGHKKLRQLVVAVSGSFFINLYDGKNSKSFILNQPNQGLLIVPGLWRELNSFSGGAICLVLASEEYDEDDYFRDYEEFLKFKQ
jgi:dTDP-4-dehydrorhamnose 3,5-epimerase-like enzyme